MASIQSILGFGSKGSTSSHKLGTLFNLKISQENFTKTELQSLYNRILTDVLERTEGLDDNIQNLLSDNCLMSEIKKGPISLIAEAMFLKSEIFLVYEKSTELVRKADTAEQQQIKKDYIDKNSSDVGVYLSFQHFGVNDMLKLYADLKYVAIVSLNKNLNMSSAIQYKASELRASVAANDAGEIEKQAKKIVEALNGGNAVLIDGADSVETSIADLQAYKEARETIAEEQGLLLGLPKSYVMGELTGGLGDSGQSDAKAIERGLKTFYVSILKPFLEKFFDVKTKFKSENHTEITTATGVLETFEITDTDHVYLSQDEKKDIVKRMFGLTDETD